MQAIYKEIKPAQLQPGHILRVWSKQQSDVIWYEVTAVNGQQYTRRALNGAKAGDSTVWPLLPDYATYAVYDRKQVIELASVLFATKDPDIMEVG